MIEKIKQQDWDNFKTLKEFVEAEKLSQKLITQIHNFHESFLLSKTYTIEELVNIPNINWLYVCEHLENWSYDSYKIAMRDITYATKFYVCHPAGTQYRYNVYEPNDYEESFKKLLLETIIFFDKTSNHKPKTLLLSKEKAEEKCQEYNDLLRNQINEFVLYQKQNNRFILDKNNSPIMVTCNGCGFNINELNNQLIISTSSKGYELKINGYGDSNFNLVFSLKLYDLVFDISTNNLIDIIQKK